MNVFDLIYKQVRKIPRGKVVTYGQVSALVTERLKNIKTKKITPRIVGWALHANKDSKVPCHRVVDRNGRLAPNFAFDGYREQRRRLIIEGVNFKDEMHVDLEKYLWQPK